MDRLAALDDRLDEVGGIPLGRDNVVALGRQPGLEQLPLGRLVGTVGSFERDEKAAARRRIGEMLARTLADPPQIDPGTLHRLVRRLMHTRAGTATVKVLTGEG